MSVLWPLPNRRPESRNTEPRIRGASHGGDLPGVDRGTEARFDPAVPARPPGKGREVRLPDPPRTPGEVQRFLRPQGRDPVPGIAEARGARIRGEPLEGTRTRGRRDASEVLPDDGPRPNRAVRGPRDLAADDRGR